MQKYVLDRNGNVVATFASDYNDKHTKTLQAGASTYEFTISKQDEAALFLDTGNYVNFVDDVGKPWSFSILSYTETHNEKTVYCEDVGIELINKNVNAYKADAAYSFAFYFEMITKNTPWTIGINEIGDLSRKLEWTSNDTGLSRLLSLLTEFDNAECKFNVKFAQNKPTVFKVDIYKQIGNPQTNVQIVYSNELNDITKTESRAEFVTAIQGEGGTPTKNADGTDIVTGTNPDGTTIETPKITFADIVYKDDNYVSAKGDNFLRAVTANKKFNPNSQDTYIEGYYSYDTESAQELLNRTLTQLKKFSTPQYTYEADVQVIDKNLDLGDTVKIIDHDYKPGLYLEARVASLEKSYTDPSKNTITFTNYRLVNSSLAQKLADLQNIINSMPTASGISSIITNVINNSNVIEQKILALQSADGRSTVYYDAKPSNAKEGDAAFVKNPDSGNMEIWNYVGDKWTLTAGDATFDDVKTQIDKAQADAQTAIGTANTAVNTASQAVSAAGFANNTADQAKTAAASAQAEASSAFAKADSAVASALNAQSDASAAVAKANSTASEFGKVEQKADSALSSALSAQSNASNAVSQASSAAADSKDAKQIAGAVSQSYKMLTDGSTMTIAELEGGLAVKLTKKDLDGYATETWTQNQIAVTADGINGTMSSIKSTVDGQTTSINDLKADSSSFKNQFTTVNDTIGKHTTDIGTLQVSSKELTTGFNTLTTDNGTNKSNISQLSQTVDGMKVDISNKIEQKDLNGYATQSWSQSQLSIAKNEITASVETVKQTVDNMQIGGVNLAPATDSDWVKLASGGWGITNISNPIYEVKDGQTYTASFEIKNQTNDVMLEIYAITAAGARNGRITAVYVTGAGSSGIVSYTFTANLPDNTSYVLPDLAFTQALNTVGSYDYRRFKIERGTKQTDWSPAPEDQATVDWTKSLLDVSEGKVTAQVQSVKTDLTNATNTLNNNITNATKGMATQTWTQGQIKTTADNINLSVRKVQSNIDNMVIGSTNYLLNSDFASGIVSPWFGSGTWSVTSDTFNGAKVVSATLDSSTAGSSSKALYQIGAHIPATTSGLISFYAKSSVTGKILRVEPWGGIAAKKDIELTTNWVRYIVPATIQTGHTQIYWWPVTAGATYYLACPQFEIGTKDTDWHLSQADFASEVEYANLEIKVNGIQGTVDNKADKSQVTQLAGQVTSVVSTANGNSSQITQLQDDINLRVQKGDVINQINISPESILIAGNKVHITGQTTIDSGIITNAMIGNATITGAQIANATIIDANIANINGSKITANSITVDKLAANFFQVGLEQYSSTIKITPDTLEMYVSGSSKPSLMLTGLGIVFNDLVTSERLVNMYGGSLGKDNWYNGLNVAMSDTNDFIAITRDGGPSTIEYKAVWSNIDHDLGGVAVHSGFNFYDHVHFNTIGAQNPDDNAQMHVVRMQIDGLWSTGFMAHDWRAGIAFGDGGILYLERDGKWFDFWSILNKIGLV